MQDSAMYNLVYHRFSNSYVQFFYAKFLANQSQYVVRFRSWFINLRILTGFVYSEGANELDAEKELWVNPRKTPLPK